LIVAKKAEVERLNVMAENTLLPLMRDASWVQITASGDAFGSAHFRHVLKRLNRKEFPKLELQLRTNGLLIKDSWDDIGIDDLVEKFFISVDAAKKETYEIVRRGGLFERLLENLNFVSKLRKRNVVQFVRLDFVVQAMNFREMPDAADMVEEFGFDAIQFQMIRSWGTYTPEEFSLHNIGDPAHVDFEEFLSVLNSPRLKKKYVNYLGFYGVPTDIVGRARDQEETQDAI
jgi:molybdenum cofactor biosynthesis enzyme MoaA